MECFLTFLALLVAFLFLTGSAARSYSRRVRRQSAYVQLARRFAGSCLQGGLWTRSGVRLRYGETIALVAEAAGRGPYRTPCTQLVIHWPDHTFRCELFPRAGRPESQSFWAPQDTPLGDEEFDRRYVVRGVDRQSLSDFFSPGVRWQIDRLRRLFSDDSVYLLIRRGRILVQKPRLLRQFEPLEAFVEASLGIYDQAMLTRSRSIEFVADRKARPQEHVLCKVCGEEILGNMVFCRRCRTPHHADCWQFAGTCSVYGCGERQCLVPQPARVSSQIPSPSRRIKPR